MKYYKHDFKTNPPKITEVERADLEKLLGKVAMGVIEGGACLRYAGDVYQCKKEPKP